MDLQIDPEKVNTREDFIKFVYCLLEELKKKPSYWENDDLDTYLERVAAWTNDMDGAFKNRGEEMPKEPSWKLFAQILLAATMYE